jgi:hypothetical protein
MFGNSLKTLGSAFGDRSSRAMMGAQMLAAPNNQAAFAAMGQGLALNADQQKALDERAKKIEYLKSLSNTNPQTVGAVEADVIDPAQAYQSMTKTADTLKPTSLMQEYNLAKEQGFQGDFLGYQQARKGKGFSVTTADGTVVQMGGGNEPKDMKEAQAKANIYASRMENSNQILEQLENEGTSLTNKIASGLPLGNYALSPEYRQYDQAKRDFINATLRQESGAVIADTEFANGERQYFPQPGDDPQTIAQKKENRRIAMEAIRQASGQPETNPTFAAENPVMPDFSTMSDEELEAIANGS